MPGNKAYGIQAFQSWKSPKLRHVICEHRPIPIIFFEPCVKKQTALYISNETCSKQALSCRPNSEIFTRFLSLL